MPMIQPGELNISNQAFEALKLSVIRYGPWRKLAHHMTKFCLPIRLHDWYSCLVTNSSISVIYVLN